MVFGLLLSIPLVVWGSGVLAKMMNRYPAIIWLGGGVLGFVAAELIHKDRWVVETFGASLAGFYHVVPYVLGIVVMALGWWWGRARGSATNEAA